MSLSNDAKRQLHVRLEIIDEQAQAIRQLAIANGPDAQGLLFPTVHAIRDVIINACNVAGITKAEGK